MASGVFHAGAFPTGAHHPLMGPENHSAHPSRATVAGTCMSSDLPRALCSYLELTQATGHPYTSCPLTEEPGISCLPPCLPPPHSVPFSSDSSPVPLYIVAPEVASGL